MAFIKQVLSDERQKHNLEPGRSVQVKLSNGQRIDGIVDFISNCQGTHHIFLNTDKENRALIKIYSNRKLKEIVCYAKQTISVHEVEHISVTVKAVQENVDLSSQDFLPYYSAFKGYKWVPVVVGDTFDKNGKLFEVIAITKNGGTMFMEDDKGNGVSVNLNDKTLIDAFSGFMWGQPDK